MADTLLDRFLRYVQVDTRSDPDSITTPSSPNQWNLLHMVANELRALGASDVHVTEYGYVLALLPATSSKPNLPTVAFLAHVDTTPDFSGHGVSPIVHRQWDGKPITLPDDPKQILDPAIYTDLKTAVGKDVITASGTTVLGADDKAGVAIVMTLVAELLAHPEIEHGPIRICFNPDEEIGRGVVKLDLNELGANVAYTLDGEDPGDIGWETFSGDDVIVTFEGISTHPGDGKRRGMVNAMMLATQFLSALPRDGISPETTDQRQGYIHPHSIRGGVDRAEIRFIIRDFEMDGLIHKREVLRKLSEAVQLSESRATVTVTVEEGYRNMGYWLKEDMTPVNLAYEAVQAIQLTPKSTPTRGGTDGSRLTERGLPTPNIFNGSHNWHGPLEWVTLQDMELSLHMCLKLVELWAQKGTGYKGYQVQK